MKKENIDAAMDMALEFITSVGEMNVAEAKTQTVYEGKIYQYTSPKHRGAVRRKSMDLTRALAEMRKP